MVGWSLFIDVEGFASIFGRDEAKALKLIGHVGDAVHRIGSRVFPDAPERLFAYGLGDGFLVVPDMDKPGAERPVAIAIAVMHHLLLHGGVAKAAVAYGEIADVSACFPDHLQDGAMGEGVLTIFPVMGTALVNAYKLGDTVSGALLVLDADVTPALPAEVQCCGTAPVLVDWLHSRWWVVDDVAKRAGIELLRNPEAEQRLLDYIRSEAHGLSQRWIQATLESVNLSAASGAF